MLLLIHTIPALVEVFTKYCKEILPNVEILHILDQPLLKRVQRLEKLIENDIKRIEDHINIGKEIGAKVVLITCSTLSPAVDTIRDRIDFPVYQIDDAMAKKAISIGNRIGLLATARSTIEPSSKNLLAHADLLGKIISIQSLFVEDALELLNSGDLAGHDEKVSNAINNMIPAVDVVVLAQASMARVCDSKSTGDWSIPVLSSPQIVLNLIKENHFK